MFFPTTIKEVRALGWDYLDVIIFTGDAYIDHPAFGASVVARVLEAQGLRVAIVPQPNWQDDLRDFKKLGVPRLFFGVTAGAMDSMVNHYTANIRLRSNDAYTPGGKAGFRPDYAATKYTQILKSIFPDVPVVVGGIEASLRRLTHYDYWQDELKPSMLVESGADILSYGMGEGVIEKIAEYFKNGASVEALKNLPQVAFLADRAYVESLPAESVITLNSYETCCRDKVSFAENFVAMERESNALNCDKVLVEEVESIGGAEGAKRFVVVNRPVATLTTAEIDASFDLPYERAPHPKYRGKGDIPAWDMIKNSINLHRGCFGGCSFCTISAHQGKFIASRSEKSILKEVERVVLSPEFKGNLSDIGGPSANMWGMGGVDKEQCGKCRRPSCLHPRPCRNLNNDHKPLLRLYDKICGVAGVKRAYIGSGIRYDLFDDSNYLERVVKNHTSGRLKVAPEHTEDSVLKLMRKPSFGQFEQLNEDFKGICKRAGLPSQLIPYFISSHPGCTERDMSSLSKRVLGRLHFSLEQVQDLTPTPMTLSSVMFYTGFDPYSGERLYVARSQDDKRRQKSYFFDRQLQRQSSRQHHGSQRRDSTPRDSQRKRGKK
ncbi:MAG: YgiQ family radical SAM protein [Rikenellaceae bacterium]